jgi:hypothetical protein
LEQQVKDCLQSVVITPLLDGIHGFGITGLSTTDTQQWGLLYWLQPICEMVEDLLTATQQSSFGVSCYILMWKRDETLCFTFQPMFKKAIIVNCELQIVDRPHKPDISIFDPTAGTYWTFHQEHSDHPDHATILPKFSEEGTITNPTSDSNSVSSSHITGAFANMMQLVLNSDCNQRTAAAVSPQITKIAKRLDPLIASMGQASNHTNWLPDSGALAHMTPCLKNRIDVTDGHNIGIEVTNGNCIQCTIKDSVWVDMLDDEGKPLHAILCDVLYVPGLR